MYKDAKNVPVKRPGIIDTHQVGKIFEKPSPSIKIVRFTMCLFSFIFDNNSISIML